MNTFQECKNCGWNKELHPDDDPRTECPECGSQEVETDEYDDVPCYSDFADDRCLDPDLVPDYDPPGPDYGSPSY